MMWPKQSPASPTFFKIYSDHRGMVAADVFIRFYCPQICHTVIACPRHIWPLHAGFLDLRFWPDIQSCCGRTWWRARPSWMPRWARWRRPWKSSRASLSIRRSAWPPWCTPHSYSFSGKCHQGMSHFLSYFAAWRGKMLLSLLSPLFALHLSQTTGTRAQPATPPNCLCPGSPAACHIPSSCIAPL